MPKRAGRVMGNPGKGAFDIWEQALALEAKGQPIIHLEIGEPDGTAPAHVSAALKQALDGGRTHVRLALTRPVDELEVAFDKIALTIDQMAVKSGELL